jgi:hypothetical protein
MEIKYHWNFLETIGVLVAVVIVVRVLAVVWVWGKFKGKW